MITKKKFHNLIELSLSDRKAELWAKITARDSAVERNEENVTSSAFRPSIRVLTAVATCCLAVIITLAVVLPGLITPGESSQPSLSELGYKPYDPTIPTVDMSTVEIRGESFTPDSVDGRVLWFGCGTPEFPTSIKYSYYDLRLGEAVRFDESFYTSDNKNWTVSIVKKSAVSHANYMMLKYHFVERVKVFYTKINDTTVFCMIERTETEGEYKMRAYFDHEEFRYFWEKSGELGSFNMLIGAIEEFIENSDVSDLTHTSVLI